MKKKSFTLIEILIGLIIVAVLASLSIVTYQKSVETNNNRICLDNLKILQGALDVYTLENNALPTTLAQLSPRYVHLAYQKIIGEPRENKFLASLRNLLGIKPALAQSPPPLAKYYANQRNVFVCPNDIGPITHKPINPPSNCKINLSPYCGSYTFDFTNGITIIDNKHLNRDPTVKKALIFDSVDRHKEGNGKARNGITPSGKKWGRVDTGGDVI